MTMEDIVRVGTVSSIDASARTARVCFPHLGNMVSGKLRVLQQYECAVTVIPDGSHNHTDSDGGNTSTVENHIHEGTFTTFWMPKVGDTVLCLYVPVFNGDGVIMGVLK